MFTPIKLGKQELKHRVVLAPLTRFRSNLDHAPSDLNKTYYEQRTSEGGLLIAEGTVVSATAAPLPRQPGIYNQEQIAAWKDITDAVHEKKGIIFLQLFHMGRAGSKRFNPNKEQTVSASAIAIEGDHFLGGQYEVPKFLEIPEIKSLVQEFRQAALNSIEAGFDGVEIHCANGYLLDQFINTSSNKRTDIYGGSIENRARFPLEVLDAVVDAIGSERTGVRFSPGCSFQDMQDDSVVETWSYLTSEIQARHPDLAFVHFIENRASIFVDGESSIVEDSLKPYREIWKGPFISAGGFSNNEKEAVAFAEVTGDLIAFGRSFIANPDLPERLLHDWELNEYDRPTFYTYTEDGYTTYPFYKQTI
jgi:2,4-dienoyl-CoA reductase-like NADH-dependent reductase (Old Yellow Enzyme family)